MFLLGSSVVGVLKVSDVMGIHGSVILGLGLRDG